MGPAGLLLAAAPWSTPGEGGEGPPRRPPGPGPGPAPAQAQRGRGQLLRGHREGSRAPPCCGRAARPAPQVTRRGGGAAAPSSLGLWWNKKNPSRPVLSRQLLSPGCVKGAQAQCPGAGAGGGCCGAAALPGTVRGCGRRAAGLPAPPVLLPALRPRLGLLLLRFGRNAVFEMPCAASSPLRLQQGLRNGRKSLSQSALAHRFVH